MLFIEFYAFWIQVRFYIATHECLLQFIRGYESIATWVECLECSLKVLIGKQFDTIWSSCYKHIKTYIPIIACDHWFYNFSPVSFLTKCKIKSSLHIFEPLFYFFYFKIAIIWSIKFLENYTQLLYLLFLWFKLDK